jgi:hypothetical protein
VLGNDYSVLFPRRAGEVMPQTSAHLMDIVVHNLATNPTEKEVRDSIFLLERALQLIEVERYEEAIKEEGKEEE